MTTLLQKEHLEVLKRELSINLNDFTALELVYIDWLYFCAQREMNPGWEGYYAWIHRPIPMRGYDFGEVENSVVLDGKYRTRESIVLHIILDWNQWNRTGKEGWQKYWLNLLMHIEHQIKPIENENYQTELVAWSNLTNKILADFVYYVPVGLFQTSVKKNPIYHSISSTSSPSSSSSS